MQMDSGFIDDFHCLVVQGLKCGLQPGGNQDAENQAAGPLPERSKRIRDPEIAEVEIPLVIMSFRNGAVK